jgi:hypothetical protein
MPECDASIDIFLYVTLQFSCSIGIISPTCETISIENVLVLYLAIVRYLQFACISKGSPREGGVKLPTLM